MHVSNLTKQRMWVILLAMVAVLSLGFSAPAAIWYVDGSLGTNGSGTSAASPFNSLQSAITAANAGGGDVVWVTGGTYAEGLLDISKQMTIAGGFNAAFTARDISGNPTVIDGQNVSRSDALVRLSTDSTLDGLTITNALNDGDWTQAYGSAIWVNNSSPVISSCTLTNNQVEEEGSVRGGTICMTGTGTPLVANCLLQGNTNIEQDAGGDSGTAGSAGISVASSGQDPTIIDTLFLDNSGVNNCYAAAFTQSGGSSDATLINCVFAGNSAGYTIAIRGGAQCLMINCTVANNSTYGGLRGTDISSGSFDLINCIIADFPGRAIDRGFHTPRGIVWSAKNCLFHNNGEDVDVNLYTVSADNTGPGGVNFIDNGGNISGQAPFFTAVNQRTWPVFTDPSTHDYTLQANSVAVDAGTATGAPADDVDGNARGNDGNTFSPGGAHDIGAYEFQGSGSWDDSALATMYIKPGGTGDGSTWANAYGDPDSAESIAGTSATIWVAAGTYTVNDTILPKPGQQWYGGFPATGDPGMGDRDPLTNQTILSRDSLNTLFYLQSGSGAVNIRFDGFIAEKAARVVDFDEGWNIVFANCAFRNNGQGAVINGVFAIELPNDKITSLTVDTCFFLGNWTHSTNSGNGRGGAMYVRPNSGTSLIYFTAKNCVFANNWADNTGTDYSAGAIAYAYSPWNDVSTSVVEDCIFVGNYSGRSGGAINHAGEFKSYEIRNCVFVGNWANYQGGAVRASQNRTTHVVNNTFIDNIALTSYGGGVAAAASNHVYLNNVFSGNDNATGEDGLNGSTTQSNNLFDTDQNDSILAGSLSGDPDFPAPVTGSATAKVYSAADNMTVIATSGLTPGALMGKIIQPDNTITTASIVVSNTATQIVVPGNFGGGASTYALLDLKPGAASPAIDTGADSYAGVTIPSTDIEGTVRPIDGHTGRLGASVDIGAYEAGANLKSGADYYVRVGGVGDGSSWANACDIDYVRDNASAGATIWLAAGEHALTNVISAKGGQQWVGGFPATGDPGMADRDLTQYESVIDGQKIVRVDALIQCINVAGVRFDGVTIANGLNGTPNPGGTGDNRGGAMYSYRSDVQVTSSVLRNNMVWGTYGQGGGAIATVGGGVVEVANSTFLNNRARDKDYPSPKNCGGGAVMIRDSGSMVLTDCRITSNSGGRGSLALMHNNASLSMTNCVADNNVFEESGFLRVRFGGSLDLMNCTFYGTQRDDGAAAAVGGVSFYSESPADVANITNCVFSDIRSSDLLAPNTATMNIRNCLFNNISNDLFGATVTNMNDLGGNISKDALLGGGSGVDTTFTFLPDFTPAFGSQAIDNGYATGAPALGINGNARVDVAGYGSALVDIGAAEAPGAPANPVHVDDDAAAGGDGSAGAPLQSIADAKAAVAGADPSYGTPIVRVAGGTYREQVLIDGKTIMQGGYAADFLSRDIAGTPSIIDGERIGRTGALVKIQGANGTRVDGFTVTRGYNANDWGTSDLGGGFFVTCQAEITSCVITGNTSAAQFVQGGGGVCARGSSADLLVANCNIHANNVVRYDPAIDGNAAGGNDGGGGVTIASGATALFLDTTITSNSGGRGGAMTVVASDAECTLKNCVVAQNKSRDNGIVFVRFGGEVNAINSTFADNTAYSGSARCLSTWQTTGQTEGINLTNCIVANNQSYGLVAASNSADLTEDIYAIANTVFYNNGDDIGGSLAGVIDMGGNISQTDLGGDSTVAAVVLFADPANYDYSLLPGSVAVDAGLTTDTAPTLDLAGNARDWDVPGVNGTAPNVVDMGAYELRSNVMPEGIFVDDDAVAGGNGTKSAPFQTIPEGIAVANPSNPYPNMDEVKVAGGTYYDPITLNEGVTVRGGYSADFSARDLVANETLLDGQGYRRGGRMVYFRYTSDNSRVDGLTIYNYNSTSNDGGGIFVNDAQGVQITSCTIDSCRAKGGYWHGGGGIAVFGDDAWPLISGCTITSNSTWYDQDSRFDYQYPSTMGGGVIVYNSAARLEGCLIKGNLSSGGGGVAAEGSYLDMTNCIVTDNRNLPTGGGSYGAGLNIEWRYPLNVGEPTHHSPVTTVTNCTFYANDHLGSSADGIRVFVHDATMWTTFTMANSIVAGHEGMGMYCNTNKATYVLVNNLFDNNGNDVSPQGNMIFSGNISIDGSVGGTAGTYTNPRFADVANLDFSLLAGSAAIDKGLSSFAGFAGTPYDYNYAARDWDVVGIGGDGAGNAWDIGAIENRAVASAFAGIYVDDDAAPGGDGSIGAPYQSLATGVAAKNPEWDGDVSVAGGTYYETVDMSPGAVVRGAYSADFLTRDLEATPSIIDGQKDITTHTRALVWFKTGDAGGHLDGFTIQNNRNAFGDREGGAISVVNADATITSCVMQNNFCLSENVKGGGGIYLYGGASQTTVTNCTFFNNFVQDTDLTKYNDGGGAVIVYAGADLLMSDCMITSCRAGRGGAFYIRSTGSTANIYNTVIGGCRSIQGGGALWFRDEAAARVVNCTLSANEGGSPDAVYYWGVDSSYGPCNTVFINNIIEGCNSVAIRNPSGDHYIELRNNLFDNNADDYSGSAADVATNNITTDGDIGGAAGTNTNPALMIVPGISYRYIILGGSQAIDAGLSVADVPAADFLGFLRDGSPDIGAIEYDSTPTSPSIIVQPGSLVLDPGDSGVLSVSAAGTPLLHYQWEFDGGSGWVSVGSDAYQLAIDAAEEADEGSYRVTISNDAGAAVSDVVTVTVNDPPVITVEPVSVHTTPGSSASFSVTVTGTAPMTFQWQKDGALADIDSDHVVTSTDTGSTYLFTDVQPDDPGVYRVQVTNSAGMARSAYVVLSIDGPIQVLRQPTTQTTSFGADATFTIFVSGSQPMTYAWTRNGLPLSDGGNVSGATTNELTIDPVDWADAMGVGYQVTVTNAFPGSGVSPIVGIRLLPTGVSPWWEMMK